MRLFPIFLVVFGILLGVIALCSLVIYLEKMFPSDAFDERQKAAQGRGNRLGMVVGMFYFVVVMIIMIQQVDKPKIVEPYLLVFIGILLMLAVDHAYCFLSQASLPLSQKPMISIVCYALGGVAQILYVIDAVEWFSLTWVGYGTAGWIHLLSGVFFLFLSAIHLIQYLRERKE